MSLIKNTGTIAGFTIISRIFGFVRDMLLARVLGAGLAADAYQLAFTLPNTFRRLFAEGAFSVAFVPMYSRRLADEDGEAKAKEFADDVLSIFIWILLGFSAVAMLAMPLIVYGLASEFQSQPGKFELAVFLSRMTFPYLFFISLVAMLSGLLNARSRFAPGAIAPVLFNITLISAILIGYYVRGDTTNDVIVVQILSAAVALSGLVQLIYLWWAVKRADVKLQIKRPRLTPEIKQLGMVILPATFGAGIYQISQFVDTFFATSLPQGSLTLLKMADRLNQMPLGIVGIALGTAILPMLSRHIQNENQALAQRLQADAFEMATLLTLPAAAETGNLTMISNTIVESVIYDEQKDRATGVRVINTATKETTEYFARIIFLNASTIHSTAILLNSSTPRFSEGLANSSGVLGHYLMDHHKNIGGSGTLEGYEDRIYKGARPGSVAIPRFRNVDKQEMNFLRGYGVWGGASREKINANQAGIGAELKEKLTQYGPWKMSLGCQAETLPNYDNKIEIDKDNKDQWGMPMIKISASYGENERLMRIDIEEQIGEMLEMAGLKDISVNSSESVFGSTVHEMGTARMGKDPKTSVLNAYNQCHDVANIFVTDGSCMVSSGNVSTSLTYMALTARACDHAIKLLNKGEL